MEVQTTVEVKNRQKIRFNEIVQLDLDAPVQHIAVIFEEVMSNHTYEGSGFRDNDVFVSIKFQDIEIQADVFYFDSSESYVIVAFKKGVAFHKISCENNRIRRHWNSNETPGEFVSEIEEEILENLSKQ